MSCTIADLVMCYSACRMPMLRRLALCAARAQSFVLALTVAQMYYASSAFARISVGTLYACLAFSVKPK